MVIPITWGSYGMLFTLVGAILELVIFSNITSSTAYGSCKLYKIKKGIIKKFTNGNA